MGRGKQIRDLTGQVFGELTVIEKTDKRVNRGVVWKCRCSCGKETYVLSNNLITGNTLACGHLKGERKARAGDRYGRLVLLRQVKEKSGTQYKWSCRCDCGNTIATYVGSVFCGAKISCGCTRKKSKSDGVYLATCPSCGEKFEIELDGNPTPQFCEKCAPKYAGRAWRVCVICGKLFPCPPSNNDTTCSPECRSERARRNAENQAARGERVWSEERHERADNNEKVIEQRKEALSKGVEAAKASPNSGRFETNVNAKVWTLISPDGTVYTVRNLTNWARENAELFGKPCNDKSAKQISGGFRAIVQTLNGNRGVEGKPRGALYYFGWTLKGLPEESDDMNGGDNNGT